MAIRPTECRQRTELDHERGQVAFGVIHLGIPIYWASQMQTICAFSTAEAEYIGLSASARCAIAISYLLEEINRKFVTIDAVPKFACTMFEDNTVALEIANVPKMRPRTRHINVSYHFFRSEVEAGRIRIVSVDTASQRADVLTKSVDGPTL